MNSVVVFEAPYIKNKIPQYARRQKYSYTKIFCSRSPRCVKCTGNHLTRDYPGGRVRDQGFKYTSCNTSDLQRMDSVPTVRYRHNNNLVP